MNILLLDFFVRARRSLIGQIFHLQKIENIFVIFYYRD